MSQATITRVWLVFGVLAAVPQLVDCSASRSARPPKEAVSAAGPELAAPIQGPLLEPEQVAEADSLLRRGQAKQALLALAECKSPSAALLRSRAQLSLEDFVAAQEALKQVEGDPALASLVQLTSGQVAAAQKDYETATAALLPLVLAGEVAARPAVLVLADALAEARPEELLTHFAVLEKMRPRDDLDARSHLLAAKAAALRKLGRTQEALTVEKERYIEEPVSLLTPETPPDGVSLTAQEHLARARHLEEAHRNERVIAELTLVADGELSKSERCEKHLAKGLALRKLRRYAEAEDALEEATQLCKAIPEQHRRALYLLAKVVSIRDGLRAIPLIEKFAKLYAGHSMVDDVLFWAGDLYQRRNREREAVAYYRRIITAKLQDDYCGEARWRLAWMSYRKGDLKAASGDLSDLLQAGPCPLAAFDRARARYWLARIAQADGNTKLASEHLLAAIEEDAMGFYGQLALARLTDVAPDVAAKTARAKVPPTGDDLLPSLCEGSLAESRAYANGRAYLARGLNSDAARELLAINIPEREVIAASHASAQGLVAKPVPSTSQVRSQQRHATSGTCNPREPRLLVALLLDKAGAYKDAHWRLRTDFARELQAWPTPDSIVVWRAAYPLAFRHAIAAAEHEAGLPELLLQALAREESAFDAQVVSWAGAYGLTQLLYATGRDAGRLLDPEVTLERPEDLLEPELNARLGGALLASLLKRYKGNAALALAAYNAGTDVATAWWKRYGELGLDVLAEEMTIQETRGYVKRVLRTFGIYRWLWGDGVPGLPIALSLPPR